MHKKREKHYKNIDGIKCFRGSEQAPFPHLNDNDIITFKIWLFDYREFKMKTDEFPF